MVKYFYVVSLDYNDGGCDSLCENASEVRNTIVDFINEINEQKIKASITLTKYEASDSIVSEFTKDEFIGAFFDDDSELINGVTELEKLTIEV